MKQSLLFVCFMCVCVSFGGPFNTILLPFYFHNRFMNECIIFCSLINKTALIEIFPIQQVEWSSTIVWVNGTLSEEVVCKLLKQSLIETFPNDTQRDYGNHLFIRITFRTHKSCDFWTSCAHCAVHRYVYHDTVDVSLIGELL